MSTKCMMAYCSLIPRKRRGASYQCKVCLNVHACSSRSDMVDDYSV
jgi:hypothetical protein